MKKKWSEKEEKEVEEGDGEGEREGEGEGDGWPAPTVSSRQRHTNASAESEPNSQTDASRRERRKLSYANPTAIRIDATVEWVYCTQINCTLCCVARVRVLLASRDDKHTRPDCTWLLTCWLFWVHWSEKREEREGTGIIPVTDYKWFCSCDRAQKIIVIALLSWTSVSSLCSRIEIGRQGSGENN